MGWSVGTRLLESSVPSRAARAERVFLFGGELGGNREVRWYAALSVLWCMATG